MRASSEQGLKVPPGAPPGWLWFLVLLLGLGLAGLPRARSGPPAPALWLSDLPYRPLEARLSLPAADHHRPYAPEWSGAASTSPLSLRELAALEERNDLRGIAAAYLLRSAPAQAVAFLERMPPSPERDNDRAVAALSLGRAEEALALLDDVLEAHPGLPQALWNRGLVLRELGLTLQAVECLEQVAALREPGWSEEARALAARLREHDRSRARSWKAAREAILSWVGVIPEGASSAPLPLEEASRFPGTLREGFYEALRAAPSRERAMSLLPLADALDRVHGGTVLHDHLLRVANRDFRLRAPLARDYALLVRDQHPAPDELVTRLRRSGEKDLYLGGLLHVPSAPRSGDELQRLARGEEDPWTALVLEEEQAKMEEAAGQWWKAEQRLLSALSQCRERGLSFRCMKIEHLLAALYTNNNRLAEASEHARAGWTLARTFGEWAQESTLLQAMGQIARFRANPSLAWALMAEALPREPDDCRLRNYVRRNLADLALSRFRVEEARRQMELALECQLPIGLLGASIITELSRVQPRADDARLVRQSLAEVPLESIPPGRRLLRSLIAGRFELEHDREAGRALLREVIAKADALPREDTDARDSRMLSYLRLLSTAGRDGAFDEVLSLAAAELEIAPLSRCVLAAAVDAERTVVAVRGPRGEVRGHYDTSRRTPLGDDVSRLIPGELLALLRGCERVDVLALPPLANRPGLLPSELAWSYRVPRLVPASRVPPPTLQLVAANVEPPPSLKLARLPDWHPPPASSSRSILLSGSDATPSRLLASMPEATEIEIHAHGMLDQGLSDASLIVLAPEENGRFALTAHDVRQLRLAGAPLVLLATCGAARMSPVLHESYSLPASFVAAGARAVFAAASDIPDSASRFFGAVRDRIRAGAAPAIALRDERLLWREREGTADWLDTVLVFE
ncbi:CHAT domain-containing protein [Archangium violaceum]|uniref:CHAT domain-containing protein n=1 Tax=Archangium violaceum TaxID=83451 RepID=UPI00193BFC80|nr:CHAT domain-containing protein [Archangium violaceum]QRK09340.1 CHAT domain-containing protein [Archangium violaceum]